MTVLDATSTTDQYAAAVRAACDDLPPSTRDELLEDLDEHLADVAAELDEGETLADRLGSAEAYAADLRQSAGYPLPTAATRRRAGFGHGRVATRVRSLWEESETHPQGRVVRDHLTDLRPAWWLARAYLAVAGLASLTSPDGFNAIPHLFGSSALGLVAVLGLGWWSARLGRATQPDQHPDDRRRRGALWFNVAAVVCLLIVLAQVDDTHTVYQSVDTTPDAEANAPGYLMSADGDPIKNIYAFAPDGTPLDGVLLYDDQGRPINAVEVWDDEGNTMTPRFPTTKDGTEVQNRYPTDFEVTGPDGLPAPAPGRPNLAVPVLEAPKTTTTTKAAPATTATPPTTTPPTTTTAAPTTTKPAS